jgi:peptidoglycan/LPS O-acetylase OafA/YrhL
MSAGPDITKQRLAGLDGVRGMACFLVFIYHLRWHARPDVDNPLKLEFFGFRFDHVLANCDSGVAIFFVLSGLILSLPFWLTIIGRSATHNVPQFYWRRICRILPAYYAVVIAVYLLRDGTYTFYGAIDCLLHFTFLQTFSDSSYYGVYPLLWTIGIEFQFYLLLPILMAGLGWLHRRGGAALSLTVLLLGTWLIDVASRSALGVLAPSIPDRILADHQSAVVSGTVFSYLKLFAFGIAGAFVLLRSQMRPGMADLVAGCSLAGFVALLMVGHEAGWRETSLLGWPLNAFVLGVFVVAVARSHRFAAIFSAPFAAWFGTISYGVYLWHELVQRAVFGGTLPNNLQGAALFAVGGIISLAVTIFIAALSWRFLEKPVLQTPYPSRA